MFSSACIVWGNRIMECRCLQAVLASAPCGQLLPHHLSTLASTHPAASQEEDRIQASDELELLAAIRSKHKARSFAVCPPGAAGRRAGAGGHVASLVLALTNNSLELWDVSEGSAGAADGEEGEGAVAHKAAASGASGAAEKAQTLDLAGHRSDVRAVALASDDSLALSASNNCVKVGRVRGQLGTRGGAAGACRCTLGAA